MDADIADALADRTVDAVVFASATHTRVDFIVRSARSGKAILLQMPIEPDLERVAAREDAIQDSNVPIIFSFRRCLDETRLATRRTTLAGAVGGARAPQSSAKTPRPLHQEAF